MRALLTAFLFPALLSAEPAVCTRVVDGDTIVATVAGTAQHIRLLRIDAPELRRPGGPEAKAYLEKLILGRTIELTGTKKDRYRRRLCEITCSGSGNIQDRLLESGHAWIWHPPKVRRAMIAAFQRSVSRVWSSLL